MMENFSNKQTVNSSYQQNNNEPQALQKTRIEIDIYLDLENTYRGESTITLTEDLTGIKHEFKSVDNSNVLDNTSFLVEGGLEIILKTTNNLRDCLLRDPYFKANFDIEVVPRKKTTTISFHPLYTLVIISKDIGKQYDCSLKTDTSNQYIEYDARVKKSNNIYAYEIVGVSIPREITLVNNPNFVTFENINQTPKKEPARIMINVLSHSLIEAELPQINIKIIEMQSGKEHPFIGVYKTKDLTDESFLIDVLENGEIATAYNLKECLMRNAFFRNNYEISVMRKKKESGLFDHGSCIELVSKGYGEQYNCRIEASYGGISAKTIELQNLYLNINFDYINISEEDAVLSFAYSKGALKSLLTTGVQGVLELSEENAGYGEFLIVKPIAGMYTLEEARIATLQNIRTCMLSIPDIAEMFEIELNDSVGLLLKYRVTSRFLLTGIDSSDRFFNNIDIPVLIPPHIYEKNFRYELELFYQKCIGADSIDDGLGDYRIELDVYTDTSVEWGSIVDNSYPRGTYLTTLSKSYFGKPLWFELNTLMSKKSTYSPLFLTAFDKNPDTKWIDPGTMSDYRFIARRTRENNTQPIYTSDVLYTINGYEYTLNDTHLGYDNAEVENYTLDLSQDFEDKTFNNKVKPLTTNLSRKHLIGQKQYLNHIIKRRNSENENPIELALLYKLYTQSGTLIDEVVDLQIDADQMYVMNTTQLNLDQFLPVYNSKTVGQIDVCMIVPIENDPAQAYVEISENISYRILPSELHTVKDFAFLNRLGGWDSMNFGGSSSNEFKVTSSSIFKTLQPGFKHYTEIESVSTKSVEEKLTVQSSPLTYDVVEWLREMAASPAVYELSTCRYVLIDDMSLKYNRQDDLFQIDLKYHYSDVFNGRMK